MNIREACELAQAIEGNSLFVVIAVGRFVMVDELTGQTKQSFRWGVSVALLSDKTDRTVVYTEDEWRSYATSATGKAQQLPAEKPKSLMRSATREEEQLSLF
jgi:hypothetical protein